MSRRSCAAVCSPFLWRNGRARRISAFSRRQVLLMVILPQAFRRMLPPWMNLYAILVMATTLISIVGIQDGLTAVRAAIAAEARPDLTMPFYLLLLALFFAHSYPIARLTRALERPNTRRMNVESRRLARHSSCCATWRSASDLSPCCRDLLSSRPGARRPALSARPARASRRCSAASTPWCPSLSRLHPGRRHRGERPAASTSSPCAATSASCSSSTTCFRTRPRCRT